VKNLLQDAMRFSIAPTAGREAAVGLLSVVVTAAIITILVLSANVDPVLYAIPAAIASGYGLRVLVAAGRTAPGRG